MRVFLSITAGPTPRQAEPVLATEDRAVIRAALEAIRARVGCGEPATALAGREPTTTSPDGSHGGRRVG